MKTLSKIFWFSLTILLTAIILPLFILVVLVEFFLEIFFPKNSYNFGLKMIKYPPMTWYEKYIDFVENGPLKK